MALTNILKARERENRRYFENYLTYAKEAKRIAEELLKRVRVYLFGSVVRGDFTPSSDIDLLIVSRNMPKSLGERAKIKAKIYRRIGVFSPFEIHMVNELELEWYRTFIKKMVVV